MMFRPDPSWIADIERQLVRAIGTPVHYRSLLARTVQRRLATGEEDVDSIASAYEALLHVEPSRTTNGQWVLRDHSRARRASGSYYTPPALIDLLLDHSLEPLLDRSNDPASLRLADPACGSGRFLLAAAHRIARRGVPIAAVIRRCIFGVDTDPIAVRLCRESLARYAECQPAELTCIRRAEGLKAWKPGTFDAIVGNPPFRNAIEGERQLAPSHPLIGGAADLAYRFLARATDLLRKGGVVALIQPRPLLNAACMDRFRRALPNGLRPNLIFAPDRSRFFPGALVFTCGLVIGPGETCRVSRDPAARLWAEGLIETANWWQALNNLLSGRQRRQFSGPRLGDQFDVWAGMTAAEAYDLRPFIRESPRAKRGRLVTTGLIDPGVCHWGLRKCRYLGQNYQHPAVAASNGLPSTIRSRLKRARRPKILVAGLSRRLECVLDREGALLGAVSTFVILHPRDDVSHLARLAKWLSGADVDRQFRDELGANAVGGGDTVMTKAFLRSLPLSRTLQAITTGN
jgi:methylase of polypeptide subunit release factors